MHELFGTKHLIIIAVSLALIVGLSILAKKLSFERLCRVLLYVGIASEITKIFCYICANEDTHGGILPKTDLPFHLCSIQIIFILIINISQNEKLKRFILSFMYPSCLIGGIAAILIATESARNMWIITVQYFIYHIAIVVFSISLMTRKEFKIKFSDYLNCLKFLLVIMFFAFYINSIVYDGTSDINFMYVASPPQSGLPFLTEKYGWLVYISHYAFLVITCVTLCYIKPIINAVKARFSKETAAEQEEKVLETSEA